MQVKQKLNPKRHLFIIVPCYDCYVSILFYSRSSHVVLYQFIILSRNVQLIDILLIFAMPCQMVKMQLEGVCGKHTPLFLEMRHFKSELPKTLPKNKQTGT